MNVAFMTYNLSKIFHLCRQREATRAALVHDFFLYDWRENKDLGWHPSEHPKQAYITAKKYIFIDKRMEDCILKHMWPCTLSLPKYRESWIVQGADKLCTIKEIVPGAIMKLKFSKVMVLSCLLANVI